MPLFAHVSIVAGGGGGLQPGTGDGLLKPDVMAGASRGDTNDDNAVEDESPPTWPPPTPVGDTNDDIAVVDESPQTWTPPARVGMM